MKKILSRLGIAGLLSLFPTLTLAQTTNNLCDVANLGVRYFNTAIELVIGLATVVFIFNIYRYFFTNKEDKAERGSYLLWSIIGFFVIVSFWGLVNLLSNTFSLNTAAPTTYGLNNTAGCNSSGAAGANGSNGYNGQIGGSSIGGGSSGSPYGSSGSYGSTGYGSGNPFGTTGATNNTSGFGFSGAFSLGGGTGGTGSFGVGATGYNSSGVPMCGNIPMSQAGYTCQNGTYVPPANQNPYQGALQQYQSNLISQGCTTSNGSPGPNAGSSQCVATQNAITQTQASSNAWQAQNPSASGSNASQNPYTASIDNIQMNMQLQGCTTSSGSPGPNASNAVCAQYANQLDQLQTNSSAWNDENSGLFNEENSNGSQDESPDCNDNDGTDYCAGANETNSNNTGTTPDATTGDYEGGSNDAAPSAAPADSSCTADGDSGC